MSVITSTNSRYRNFINSSSRHSLLSYSAVLAHFFALIYGVLEIQLYKNVPWTGIYEHKVCLCVCRNGINHCSLIEMRERESISVSSFLPASIYIYRVTWRSYPSRPQSYKIFMRNPPAFSPRASVTNMNQSGNYTNNVRSWNQDGRSFRQGLTTPFIS